jgi:hypothetical protein
MVRNTCEKGTHALWMSKVTEDDAVPLRSITDCSTSFGDMVRNTCRKGCTTAAEATESNPG